MIKEKNLMQAGIKYYTYRSTMLAYTDFFDFLDKEVKEQKIVDVIMMLWTAYSIGTLLNSVYFEHLIVGDGWYKLHVQKYVNDTYSVKLEINPNYANALGRFTK